MKTHKPKLLILATLIIPLILPWGCKSAYVPADFESRTADHKTVAVLPFEMVFTGMIPDRLTEYDVELIEEAESKAFMISFHHEILRSTRGGRDPIRVDVQHFEKTLKILARHDMDVRSAWREDPERLAFMLGVDAVVKARIEKYRLMSDFTSYGIELGVHILNVMSDYRLMFWLPPGLTKAKEIRASYTMVDRKGATIWSIAYDIDADWRMPSNEIIDNINRRASNRFPYRIKKTGGEPII